MTHQGNHVAALKLHSDDNVAVALRDLPAGAVIPIGGKNLRLKSNVAAKHKFATQELQPSSEAVMYGLTVGRAKKLIAAGEWLSTENLDHAASEYRYSSNRYRWHAPDATRWKKTTFAGYRRFDGQVGTRNYWLVVSLVSCENRNGRVLQQAFEEELGYAIPSMYRRYVAELARLVQSRRPAQIPKFRFSESVEPFAERRVFRNVDGIRFLAHAGECGGTREDAQALQLIAGYIHHPNVAGATVLSLGSQSAQVEILREELRNLDRNFSKPLLVFDQQRSGLESKMLKDAIRATMLGLVEVNNCRREPVPLAHLRIGLKCGGSDGFSGISANPAVGHLADLIVALGGAAILSEFPELGGVEQNLIDRCRDSKQAGRFMELMRCYSARATAVGSGFHMNPSPGNIGDALITDAMKSAAAAKKGGTSPVMAVLDYPEYSTEPGLNLQCTPANDVECVTAQVGAGANIVLFTTGLGTITGNPIAPVVKISTNTQLAERMTDIIDIDCGGVISGEVSVEQMGEEIMQRVVWIASGDVRARAELRGQDDFIPWKRGVSL